MKTLKKYLVTGMVGLGSLIGFCKEVYSQNKSEWWRNCQDTDICLVYKHNKFGLVNIPLSELRESYEISVNALLANELRDTLLIESASFFLNKFMEFKDSKDKDDSRYAGYCLSTFQGRLATLYIKENKLFLKNKREFERFLEEIKP